MKTMNIDRQREKIRKWVVFIDMGDIYQEICWAHKRVRKLSITNPSSCIRIIKSFIMKCVGFHFDMTMERLTIHLRFGLVWDSEYISPL